MTDRLTERLTDRQTDRPTNVQRDGQTARRTDGWTNQYHTYLPTYYLATLLKILFIYLPVGRGSTCRSWKTYPPGKAYGPEGFLHKLKNMYCNNALRFLETSSSLSSEYSSCTFSCFAGTGVVLGGESTW